MLTLGIILLILVGFAMTKLKVTIRYSDDVVVIIEVLGIRIRIPPKKKKRIKPMTAKEAAKIREQREKAAEQKRLKAIAKAKKKKQKQAAAKQKKEALRKDPEARRKAKEKKKKKKEKAATLQENLDLVGKVVGFFFSGLLGHLRIDVARLHVIVGSPEAAKTAILYGAAVQGVGYILAFLDKASNLKGMKRADVYVDADFLSEELRIDIDISISLRIWHLFHLIGGTLKRVIKNRMAVSKRVKAEHPPHKGPSAVMGTDAQGAPIVIAPVKRKKRRRKKKKNAKNAKNEKNEKNAKAPQKKSPAKADKAPDKPSDK